MGKLMSLFSSSRIFSSIDKRWFNIDTFLFTLILISVFLLPGFHPLQNTPEFQFTDILFPFIVLYLLFQKQKVVIHKYIYLSCGFIFIILLSILLNKRYQAYNDYFEIYKFAKFIVFVLFVSQISSRINLNSIFTLIFYLLFLFNVFHFFDFFEFNNYIEPFYANGIHLDLFGLNTIGQPDTKRMLGTFGNPNNNAIAFLFFAVFFFPKKGDSIFKNLTFYLSFISFLACQSRTAFIAFGIIYLLYLILSKMDIKSILIQLSILLLSFSFIQHIDRIFPRETYIYVKDYYYLNLDKYQKNSNLFRIPKGRKIMLKNDGSNTGTKYLSSLVNGKLGENSSLASRVETWKKLGEMVKQKPLIGHAPYKQYFYENNMYSENEYILILWRYGFLGLILYLIWLLFPFLLAIKQYKNEQYRLLIYFSIGIFITALTNNPLTEPRIFMLYAVVVGLFFNQYTILKKVEESKKNDFNLDDYQKNISEIKN